MISCSDSIVKTKHGSPTSSSVQVAANVMPGANNISEYIEKLKEKNVALVVNQTSVVSGVHLLDTLLSLNVKVKCAFVPEHGFRGEKSAGESIKDQKDSKTNIALISLYGNKKKPTKDDLAGIDLIVFDIQDVGVRFFTYISTLHYIMEVCAEHHIELLVLDRPNPNAHYIDGPVLKPVFKSFVGMHQIPVVYGMTIGELAKMIKGERWIKFSDSLDMQIIPCQNYTHQTKVKLSIKPSPNLPNERAILLYPSLCLFEGTEISLGRGTDAPFQIYGHPDFELFDTTFTPIDRAGALNPPQEGKLCKGFSLQKLEAEFIRESPAIQLLFLLNSYKQYPQKSNFFLANKFFDKLAGTDELRLQILNGTSESSIRKSWKKDLDYFKSIRKKYLLYAD